MLQTLHCNVQPTSFLPTCFVVFCFVTILINFDVIFVVLIVLIFVTIIKHDVAVATFQLIRTFVVLVSITLAFGANFTILHLIKYCNSVHYYCLSVDKAVSLNTMQHDLANATSQLQHPRYVRQILINWVWHRINQNNVPHYCYFNCSS